MEAMGLITPNRRNNPNRGQGIADNGQPVRRDKRLVVVFLELAVDHVFGLIRIIKLKGEHTEAVGDQVNGKVILLQFGILGEDRAFLWILNVFVKGQHAVLLIHFGQCEHQIQQINVILVLPFWPFEGLCKPFGRALDVAERVGCDERPIAAPPIIMPSKGRAYVMMSISPPDRI